MLAEAVTEQLRAYLCEHCGRPFLPKATNKKRFDEPPRFCATSCRVSAARKRAKGR